MKYVKKFDYEFVPIKKKVIFTKANGRKVKFYKTFFVKRRKA